jgi:hypothetical protein
MSKHILVFSHGFGVKKDDRGLFTDIATAFPESKIVMFDYNKIDEADGTLTVRTLTQQAAMLTQILEKVKSEEPDAIIDLICHSQGALVAGIAQPKGIRKTVFLAPLLENTERMIEMFRARPGTEINMKGNSYLTRSDGSRTVVPKEYWTDYMDTAPIPLYNLLADNTELTIVIANQDEILEPSDTQDLRPKIKVIEMDGSHNFPGEARVRLTSLLKETLAP